MLPEGSTGRKTPGLTLSCRHAAFPPPTPPLPLISGPGSGGRMAPAGINADQHPITQPAALRAQHGGKWRGRAPRSMYRRLVSKGSAEARAGPIHGGKGAHLPCAVSSLHDPVFPRSGTKPLAVTLLNGPLAQSSLDWEHANPTSYLFQDPAGTPGLIPTSRSCRAPLAHPPSGQPIAAEPSQACRRKLWLFGQIVQPHLWRGKHWQGC